MQDAVRELLALTSTLSDDIDSSIIERATPILDQLVSPIEADDVEALLSMLPSNGDTAFGLNWTILHAIESSTAWPRWDLLVDNRNEWIDMLAARLKNAGHERPDAF